MKNNVFKFSIFNKIVFITIIMLNLNSQISSQNYTRVNVNIEHRYPEFTYILGSALMEFRNAYYSEKKRRIEQEKALAKLKMIKSNYESYSNYPDTIAKGWHNIIATNDLNFCNEAKVFVENNQIQKFVIDNYIPVNFIAVGTIKNCKNLITLKDFNGEQLEILTVYFLYDIENPTFTTEPIEPGYICFWSDLKSCGSIDTYMDGKELRKLTTQFYSTPDCFESGTVCLIKKPGTYHFKALGRGAIKWTGIIEVRAGMCTKYKFGRDTSD